MTTSSSSASLGSSLGDVSASSVVNPEDCLLFMECSEEALSGPQRTLSKLRNQTFREQIARLEELAKAGAKITTQENGTVNFRVTETSVVLSSPRLTTVQAGSRAPAPAASAAPVPPVVSALTGGALTVPRPPSLPPSPSSPLTPPVRMGSIPRHPGSSTGYRFLMDSRTGKILGTIDGSSAAEPSVGNVAQRPRLPLLNRRMPSQVPGQRPPVPNVANYRPRIGAVQANKGSLGNLHGTQRSAPPKPSQGTFVIPCAFSYPTSGHLIFLFRSSHCGTK